MKKHGKICLKANGWLNCKFENENQNVFGFTFCKLVLLTLKISWILLMIALISTFIQITFPKIPNVDYMKLCFVFLLRELDAKTGYISYCLTYKQPGTYAL